jgi:hypothetical protein
LPIAGGNLRSLNISDRQDSLASQVNSNCRATSPGSAGRLKASISRYRRFESIPLRHPVLDSHYSLAKCTDSAHLVRTTTKSESRPDKVLRGESGPERISIAVIFHDAVYLLPVPLHGRHAIPEMPSSSRAVPGRLLAMAFIRADYPRRGAACATAPGAETLRIERSGASKYRYVLKWSAPKSLVPSTGRAQA